MSANEPKVREAWAIKVVWADGEEEYLKQGMTDVPARFNSRYDAIEQSKFMRMGMDDGDCQSINIVPYPKEAPNGE